MASTQQPTPPKTTFTPNVKTFFFYGISSLALIALADVQPQAAILFTVILIVGVLLNNWQDYAGYLSPPTTAKK